MVTSNDNGEGRVNNCAAIKKGAMWRGDMESNYRLTLY